MGVFSRIMWIISIVSTWVAVQLQYGMLQTLSLLSDQTGIQIKFSGRLLSDSGWYSFRGHVLSRPLFNKGRTKLTASKAIFDLQRQLL